MVMQCKVEIERFQVAALGFDATSACDLIHFFSYAWAMVLVVRRHRSHMRHAIAKKDRSLFHTSDRKFDSFEPCLGLEPPACKREVSIMTKWASYLQTAHVFFMLVITLLP